MPTSVRPRTGLSPTPGSPAQQGAATPTTTCSLTCGGRRGRQRRNVRARPQHEGVTERRRMHPAAARLRAALEALGGVDASDVRQVLAYLEEVVEDRDRLQSDPITVRPDAFTSCGDLQREIMAPGCSWRSTSRAGWSRGPSSTPSRRTHPRQALIPTAGQSRRAGSRPLDPRRPRTGTNPEHHAVSALSASREHSALRIQPDVVEAAREVGPPPGRTGRRRRSAGLPFDACVAPPEDPEQQVRLRPPATGPASAPHELPVGASSSPTSDVAVIVNPSDRQARRSPARPRLTSALAGGDSVANGRRKRTSTRVSRGLTRRARPVLEVRSPQEKPGRAQTRDRRGRSPRWTTAPQVGKCGCPAV
jgi:hypothetical protein